MADFNRNQMKEDALIKEGRYFFRVLDAREKRSTAGTDMISLKLGLSIGGREVVFWSTLFFAPKMFWLIEHFCDTTGMLQKLDEGRILASDCVSKIGYVDIGQKVNQETGEVENLTKDFVRREKLNPEELVNLGAVTDSGFDDSDIPNFG